MWHQQLPRRPGRPRAIPSIVWGRRDQADGSLVVCGRERPPMNLGVALAECRSGRAGSGSDGSMTVGYGGLSFPLRWKVVPSQACPENHVA
jgi:hypothetical protein